VRAGPVPVATFAENVGGVAFPHILANVATSEGAAVRETWTFAWPPKAGTPALAG